MEAPHDILKPVRSIVADVRGEVKDALEKAYWQGVYDTILSLAEQGIIAKWWSEPTEGER